MREEGDQKLDQVELHEEFIQHVGGGSSETGFSSGIGAVVVVLLIISCVSQLVLPLTRINSVAVNRVDPTLIATDVAVPTLAIVWFYVSVREYRFTTSFARQIAEARDREENHGLAPLRRRNEPFA